MEFNLAARPALAGSYFNWEGVLSQAGPPPSIGALVAIAGYTGDWGPLKSSVVVTSLDGHDAIFGASDTPGRRAVYQAFLGQGLPGKGGAGGVLIVREGTPAAAKATRVLLNTAAANAITLTARYEGTRGNDFAFDVQAGVAPGTKDLVILDGARPVATYTFAQADMAALVAQINLADPYWTAAVDVDGTALADVAGAQAAGGDDGDVLTATEHADVQARLVNERFSLLAPANLADDAIRASYIAWQADQNALGKRFESVFGGPAGELIAAGNTRSQGINDPDVVNISVDRLHDDVLGRDLSGAELAPRVAGAIAQRGERKDAIYVRFAGLSVPDDAILPSLTEQAGALKAGTTTFARDTNVTAPVFIREGLTTYSDDSGSPVDQNGNKLVPAYDPQTGVKLFASLKNVRIMQGVELAVDEWATSGDVIGELPVNDRTRALVVGRVAEEYAARESNQVVQPGWKVGLDPQVAVSDDDDFVAYVHGFHPTRSLRQMFHTGRVG